MRQADLARLVDVHQSQVARWENDLARPRPKMLDKIAEALGVQREELMAVDHHQLGSRLLEEKDPELVELFRQAHVLGQGERDGLKQILKSMIAKAGLEQVLETALGRIGSEARPELALIGRKKRVEAR